MTDFDKILTGVTIAFWLLFGLASLTHLMITGRPLSTETALVMVSPATVCVLVMTGRLILQQRL